MTAACLQARELARAGLSPSAAAEGLSPGPQRLAGDLLGDAAYKPLLALRRNNAGLSLAVLAEPGLPVCPGSASGGPRLGDDDAGGGGAGG